MRILLVFIVILNLLYAGWAYLAPVVVDHAMPPIGGDLKMLELLNETNSFKKAVAKEALESGVENSLGAPDASIADNRLDKAESVFCYTLGPFKDVSIMQQLRESIAEYVVEVSVRKRQESEKHRYWVYMPALPNRQEAKLMAKALRKKKIDDFYIVLNGNAKNSISLGHFREPKHANRRMKRVIGLGFKAEINVIYRNYDIYWLDYQVDMVNGASGFSVDEYISDGVSQLARSCKS